jgi:hypothetical protein
MVITVDDPRVVPLSVTFTKIPTVPPVLPAVNVMEGPGVPDSEPIALLERDHTYLTPDVGQEVLHVMLAVKAVVPPDATVGAVGPNVTEVRVLVGTETVITVDAVVVLPPSVALTKIPTVPAVLPAVKVTDRPELPESEPSALLERDHAYVIPPGHVELQLGVAVKVTVPPEDIEGVVGPTATELRVMGADEMVITVEVPLVVPPRVALTKSPTVPAVPPAVKVTWVPLVGLNEPKVAFERAHVYVIPAGHVELHVGDTVNTVELPAPTVGAVGLTATEERVTALLLVTVMLTTSLVAPS